MTRLRANLGLGYRDEPLDLFVISRGGAKSRGDTVEFDFTQFAAETTTVTAGVVTGPFVNVVTPTAMGVTCGLHAVCLEDIGDDEFGWVRMLGRVEATVEDSNTDSVSQGGGVLVSTSGTLDHYVTGSAGSLYRGMTLGAISGGSATPVPVFFNGMPGGLGTYVTGTGGGTDA